MTAFSNKPSIKPLIALDFDRTIADTFSPPPDGFDVSISSNLAIQKLYGEDGAAIYYDVLGGHGNREPSELVGKLLHESKVRGVVFDREIADLRGETRGFVDTKLSYMLPQISEGWPRLYPGAKDFFHAVQNSEASISVAVVSSGHDEFIKKTFQVNGLEPPKLFITSDALQDINEPKRPKYKPHPYQLARVHKDWIKDTSNSFGYGSDIENKYLQRGMGKANMMYIGDDPNKDGGLAERSRILYGFVPFVKPEYKPDAERGQVLIRDFNHLAEIILEHTDALRKGVPFSEIFLQKKDHELFPPLKENERPYGIEAYAGLPLKARL